MENNQSYPPYTANPNASQEAYANANAANATTNNNATNTATNNYGYANATNAGSHTGASSQTSSSTQPNANGQIPVPPYQGKQKKQKEKKPKEKRSNGNFGKSFGAGFLGALVAILIFLLVFNLTPLFKGQTATKNASGGTITIENAEDASIAEAVSAKCIDSVVTVYVYSTNSDWSKYFGGNSSNNSESPSGLGSGVIIKSDDSGSYVLTNYHVIKNINKASVSVNDEMVEASPVAGDESTDLAVLKIPTTGLTALEWGDSASLKVGEWVMAIGSPYGYEKTVTTGVVSALYRSDVISDTSGTTVYTDMIQTDAAINPGNSGGALVNKNGELIGINTYISSQSQSSAGLGFAIPASEAKSIAEQLLANQKISHAWLGVSSNDSTSPKGAKIVQVIINSPAEKAGLQSGDVITKVGDTAVSSANDLTVAITKSKAGETYDFTINRNGSEQTIKVTLGDKSESNQNASQQNNQGQDNGSSGNGYSLEDFLKEFEKGFGLGLGYGSGNY